MFGHRLSDGRIFYIEVKKSGGRIRENQKKFLKAMRDTGALAGIAYSVEDAIRIVSGEE